MEGPPQPEGCLSNPGPWSQVPNPQVLSQKNPDLRRTAQRAPKHTPPPPSPAPESSLAHSAWAEHRKLRVLRENSWRGQMPTGGTRNQGDAWLFSEDYTCAPGGALGSLPHLSPGPSASDLCAASGCCPARPPRRPPLPGTFLGTSGWAGPPGRVELPQKEGEQDTPPTSPGQNFPAPPRASSCHRFAYSLCACVLRTHSGPSHRQPEPQASVPVFQHFGGPLPLSWVLGTLLGTRPTWSLVPAPWLRFDR